MDEPKINDLPALIIEKRSRFLDNYCRELEIVNRIVVLEEKIDQLEHWIKEEPSTVLRLDKRKTESELIELKKKVDVSEYKERANLLDKKIEEHKRAIEYWKKKNE